jgi:hypothetical protein
MRTKPFPMLIVTATLLATVNAARAGHGCPLDHFAIGQLGGEGSHTGQLFADVEELYTIHIDGPPSTKPYASHYPLNYVWYYEAYVNGEPGTEEIEYEDDPVHALAGERLVDYDIWLEIVDISDNFWIGYGGNWYTAGDRIHLSSVQWHHLHMDYWIYESVYDEDKMLYVVYRLVDDLADGQQYDPSDEFWVVFNAPVPGDFNADSHIDQDDLDHFETCATGPAVPQEDPACQDADLDEDSDVDQSDFGLFQRCLSGPDDHPDPRCAH